MVNGRSVPPLRGSTVLFPVNPGLKQTPVSAWAKYFRTFGAVITSGGRSERGGLNGRSGPSGRRPRARLALLS